MYLSNFEARAFFDRKPGRKVSLCARTWTYRRVEAWQHWDFFSCAQFPRWRGRNKRCCLFFLQQRSHEEKRITVILGLELTNITCFSSSESDDKTIRPTVSTAVVTFACCMRRQSSLWNVTHYDSAKCIFSERLKEVVTAKPFNNAQGHPTIKWTRSPDIFGLLVMFKDCLKSCFNQLEKFDLFGFLSKKLKCPKILGNELLISEFASLTLPSKNFSANFFLPKNARRPSLEPKIAKISLPKI